VRSNSFYYKDPRELVNITCIQITKCLGVKHGGLYIYHSALKANVGFKPARVYLCTWF